jgi:hypothetical protein
VQVELACCECARRSAADATRLAHLVDLGEVDGLERVEQTGARAREEQWPYDQFIEAVLEVEVFAGDAFGA